jgi:hypothetical protein
MPTKQELINAVCSELRIPSFAVSRGSTEPRLFLVAVIDQLGIQVQSGYLDKASLGRLIVESGGRAWLPSYDSTGGTITKLGLEAIRETVHRLVGRA